MDLTNLPTELTTSATDAVLAIECIVITVCLWRTATSDRWRTALWCWVFGLMAFSSLLGAITHGFEMPNSTREVLWKPLYLSMWVVVALFMVGTIYDWRGRVVAERLVPWAIGTGAAFFGLAEFLSGSFILFVAYEATAMVCALAIYSFLAVTRRLLGAGIVVTTIVLNLAAAGAQASAASIWIFVPFDHNGIFHVIQMVGAAILGLGLRTGMHPEEG